MKSPLESFAHALRYGGIQNTMKTKAKRILATLFWLAIIAVIIINGLREQSLFIGGSL